MNKVKKIRVLVADDSFFTRKILREILNSDPSIEIVGEAKDGIEAVEKALMLRPDVVTMDHNMPKVNGVIATRMILETDPSCAIVMLSAYTRDGAEETMESLRAGAVDFIAKPTSEIAMDLDKVQKDILSKIKAAAHARVIKYKDLNTQPIKTKIKLHGSAPFKIVIIGSSTGGPPILENIFSELPRDLRAGFLVVQHMPKKFTKSLADRLNKSSNLEIKEAEEGDVIKQGLVLIAPGDFHMEIKKVPKDVAQRAIHLTEDPPVLSLRPSINVTLNSAAKFYEEAVIGIILTGMGEDGKIGMKSIKDAGGHVIAQDPETTVIDSMPKAVIDAGLADEILNPERIVQRIIELTS